jgi:hypothetical protein
MNTTLSTATDTKNVTFQVYSKQKEYLSNFSWLGYIIGLLIIAGVVFFPMIWQSFKAR